MNHVTHTIRVGTASWTEKTLLNSGAFYPQEVNTAETRLGYYARHFDTVEVDATYYALPTTRNAALWAQRTPDHFVFHIKAYSMLTGHPTLTKALPRALKDQLPREILERDRTTRFPGSVVREAFEWFRSALSPLKEAGKLGCVLFQFPPWFVPSHQAYRWLEEVRRRLPDYDLAVEFRHMRWLAPGHREKSLTFLVDHGMTAVIIDGPWIKDWKGPVAVTAPIAYVRFHGRNRTNWYKKRIETAQRYRYLYRQEELADWVETIRPLAQQVHIFAIFNNCYQDYGIRNAQTFQRLLDESRT